LFIAPILGSANHRLVSAISSNRQQARGDAKKEAKLDRFGIGHSGTP
jgi:hypothetical protein